MAVPRFARTHNQGFAILLTVIVAGAVGLTIVATVLLLGVDMARSSLVTVNSHQAGTMADTCAEEALEQIRESDSFTGTNNVTIDSQSCSYTVTNTGGTTRSITANSTVNNITRRVSITITAISPSIVVSSWQEVAD
jgi:hypothetical protein